MSDQTQSGGAATISGVLYQTLWCLLRSLRIQLRDRLDNVESSEALLVFEPAGGGGDFRVIQQTAEGEATEIEQLKAKSDGGTWSLQTVIREVLPDLFLATNGVAQKRRFRFVTEGTIGRWSEVDKFFRRLGKEELPDDVLGQLDDVSPLKFQTSRKNKTTDSEEGPFFAEPSYTERKLFLLIVQELRRRPAIVKLHLAEAELHRRLWTLLGAFEFVGGQRREVVQHEIDQLLLAVVDRKEEIPTVRDSLALLLLRKAGTGNAAITAESLLVEHRLNAVPFTDWSRIRSRSQDELQRRLSHSGYILEFDVRKDAMESIARTWRDSARTLVIAGQSGQGKTWALASVATVSASDDAPVLWVEATGNTKDDLSTAAEQFCHDVRGADSVIPLRQIVTRIDALTKSPLKRRLRVCFDNVPDYNEAANIVRDDWPFHGVSVALSCSSEVAASLQQSFGDRVDVVPCEDFSWEELHELLERRLDSAWTTIPDDMRETLRRPLLASIYCDELFDDKWLPNNEYELFAAIWKRLSTRQQTNSPLDAVLIENLAERVMNGEPYPWTLSQLDANRVGNEALVRLERCGWLVRTSDGRVRIFHDRLLNWAVAQSLFSAIQSGQRSAIDVINQIAELSNADGRIGRVYLGYVPMDFLWLLTGDSNLVDQAGATLLEALEPSYGNQTELLYRKTAPTLGQRIAGVLFQRYCNIKGYPWIRRAIAEAIAATAKERLPEFAKSLLSNADPHQQRRGLKLLRLDGCPSLLDQIWELHVRGFADPTPFLEKHEHALLFREDSWKALRRSAVLDADWIIRKIKEADPTVEPIHDLGWLISNLPDGAVAWQKSKTYLFEKVSPEKPRVLAHCIGMYRDSEHLPWLLVHVSDDCDRCGPVALQALSRIAPDEAVAVLDRAEPNRSRLSSAWSFSEVWHRRPNETNNKMLSWASSSDDPWTVAGIYRHRVNDLEPVLFDLLLQRLEERLRDHLTNDDKPHLSPFYFEFLFVADVVAPRLLDVLQLKRGTGFESALTQYLRRLGARKGIDRDSLEREPAMTILRRINGEGFTLVVNEYLECDNRYGRHDALEWGVTRPNDKTFELASKVVERDELWENFPSEQNDAMRLLAAHRRWKDVAAGLIRWGLQTSLRLDDDRLVPRDYSAPWIDELRVQLKENPTPGNVMALAFVGTTFDLNEIHSIWESTDSASELAHSCVIAMEMLQDNSNHGVQLVAHQLAISPHHYSATRMLTQAGTPAAWDAIWSDLKTQFDHINALNLINLSQHAGEVIQFVLSRLPSHVGFGDWDLLRILICELRPEHKQRLLADRWLREKFHREAVAAEGNGWFVGSKSAAIECLAEFDRDAAFEAARQSLQTPDWHDRERYPYLLFEINSARAIPLLLKHLDDEKAGHVRHAIGRVFANVDLEELLCPNFESSNAKTRVSACFAAGWARDGAVMDRLIRRCLDDLNEAVIAAAIDAIDRLRDCSICAELIERVKSSDDLALKWMYLDTLVEAIDPGDDFRPWPVELREASINLSPVVLRQISERAKQRRKKQFDELKKASVED